MSKFSRRSILKSLAVAPSAVTAIAGMGTPRRRAVGTELNYGLFFDESDLPALRIKFQSPRFSLLREHLTGFDYAAETHFLENEIRYNDQLFTLRRLPNNIEEQAFLYLMTGSDAALAIVRSSIEAIMKFDRWDFFLDGDKSIGVQRAPAATMAVSLACDWLGSAVSEEERRRWIHTMGERGVQACYNSSYAITYPTTVSEWRFDPESTYFEHRPNNRTDQNRRAEITQNTNLRAVPASALAIGAIVHKLELGVSKKSNEWLDLGLKSVEAFRDIFKPDGSYDEEVQYSNYTALHLLQAAIVSDRVGIKNIYNIINWDGYADFVLNMSMPIAGDPYDVVNFGDSGNSSANSAKRTALPYWIASRNGNRRAQWLAENRAGYDTVWSVIWYNPKITPLAPDDGPAFSLSDVDRVVVRTGWKVDDTVIGFRSGPPANHEHADRNSILITAFGEKLVTDPLRPPYSFADPSWRMRLTEGHSAVLIDGAGHEHHNGIEGTNASNSYARIKEYQESDRFCWWRSVATQPYRLVDTDVKNVIRSVAVLFENNTIIISDFIDKYDHPSTVTARFFGDNGDGDYRSTLQDTGFTVVRPNASLVATSFCNVPFSVRRGDPFVSDEVSSMHPFVDLNVAESMDTLLVSVLTVAGNNSKHVETSTKQTETGFEVSVGPQKVIISRESIAVVE